MPRKPSVPDETIIRDIEDGLTDNQIYKMRKVSLPRVAKIRREIKPAKAVKGFDLQKYDTLLLGSGHYIVTQIEDGIISLRENVKNGRRRKISVDDYMSGKSGYRKYRVAPVVFYVDESQKRKKEVPNESVQNLR